MHFPPTDPIVSTLNPTAMKPSHNTATVPARASVSAFTILIERALQVFSQVLLLPAPTPRPVPIRSATIARRR